jgi:hypothetical protein
LPKILNNRSIQFGMNFAKDQIDQLREALMAARNIHTGTAAYMHAMIVVPGHRTFPPCIVREVTPQGARLEVDSNWILPRDFWLLIAGDAYVRYCTLRWRHGESVNVNFKSGQRSSWLPTGSGCSKRLPDRARV